MTLSEQEIVQEFEQAGAILRGHFVLSSGLHSDTYLQCARVLMDPGRAEKLCAELARKVRGELGKQRLDAVISPAMGGVVVGYEMARQLKLSAMFCERVEGKFQLRRGFDLLPGARVLIVEDVVTTGKSSLEAVECVRALGGEVVAEAALIDRSGEHSPLPFPLVTLLALTIPTYPADKLPPFLELTPPVKPGSRDLPQKTETKFE